MAILALKDTNWTDHEATANGHVPGSWYAANGKAYVSHNNAQGSDPDFWNDTGRQPGYLHLTPQAAGTDNNVLAVGNANYDPRLTTGNGGDNHLVAVCVKIGALTDVFGLNLSCSQTAGDYGVGNGFRVLIDPTGTEVGLFRIDAGALGAGGWLATGAGNLAVGQRIILLGYMTHTGNAYKVRGTIAFETDPSTSLINGGLWAGPPDASDAGHVGNVAHGFGLFKNWSDRWTGGVVWARSWIGLTDGALSADGVYFDWHKTTNSTIALKALRPQGGTEPYVSPIWYRHTDNGVAKASPNTGTVISGTSLGVCNDSTALSNVDYYYVRKVTDSAGSPATAYSAPVHARLHRIP